MNQGKPVLGITMGDAAGIGPEIVAKALLRHADLRDRARLVVVGDADAMRRGAQLVGLDPHAVRVITDPRGAANSPDTIEVVQCGPSLAHVPLGQVHRDAGDGAYRFVVEACRLSKAGAIDGIVTAPLNKTSLHEAGHLYPGHTELLAEQFGVKNFSLVLSAGELYVFHITTHMSLRQAIESITQERVGNIVKLAAAFAHAVGIDSRSIVLAGLNPHAGENGLFGTEEIEVLAPVVKAAREAGVELSGPLPPDAVIPQAMHGQWKILIACYHDQGHVPFKAVFGNSGVNITIGLPTVRVSVDHGTAFDIVGRGLAQEASLVLACERAADLAPNWGGVWDTVKRGA